MSRAADMILRCLDEKNMSQKQLADSIGEDVRNLNQQLNRQKDMKVERFVEVLDHIGYRVEVVENDEVKKACMEYAAKVIENGEPKGLFFAEKGDGYIGIDSSGESVEYKEFAQKEECMQWLADRKNIQKTY